MKSTHSPENTNRKRKTETLDKIKKCYSLKLIINSRVTKWSPATVPKS